MPAYQGEFDGLCGMYAIVNAYEICGYGDIRDELFSLACNALARRRWPEVIWNGTTFGDMRRMTSTCQMEIDNQYEEVVTVSYPFLRNTPRNNGEYWERLQEGFINRNVYCCIVGIEVPSQHWIVAYPDTTKRMNFVDSSPFLPQFRKNRSSIHAGKRRRRERQWRLNRQELIVFSD